MSCKNCQKELKEGNLIFSKGIGEYIRINHIKKRIGVLINPCFANLNYGEKNCFVSIASKYKKILLA